MVLFKPGMECSICHRPIKSGEAKVGFRSFVPNEADPLFMFNEAAVHRECLDQHPLGLEAQERYLASVKENSYDNRICAVCGQGIATSDEYVGLGHLTSDPSDILYRFNFNHFHRSCLPSWNDLAVVRASASDKLRTGEWVGAGMERIVMLLGGRAR